jgi:hypothetical protein
MSDQNEKRAHPRYVCDGGIEVRSGESRGFWGTLTDISDGGCYVQTFSPMQAGTEVRLHIKARGVEIRVAQARVACFHPGVGMGIQFLLMEEEETKTLTKLLEELAHAEQPSGFDGTIVRD